MIEFTNEMILDSIADDYTESDAIDYDPDYYSLRDDFTE